MLIEVTVETSRNGTPFSTLRLDCTISVCHQCLPMSLEMLIPLVKISALKLIGSSTNLLCKPECASPELALCANETLFFSGFSGLCASYATKFRVFTEN